MPSKWRFADDDRWPRPCDGAGVCRVTAPPDRARGIAEALVERALAACVNVVALAPAHLDWISGSVSLPS
jgi:hypothetical protein